MEPLAWGMTDAERMKISAVVHQNYHMPEVFSAVWQILCDRRDNPIVPSNEEWIAAMDTERARQEAFGYTNEYDSDMGVAHLLEWAIDYARRGKTVETATLVRQALSIYLVTTQER